jgi:tetratricopeptide (TPR) repeat protein
MGSPRWRGWVLKTKINKRKVLESAARHAQKGAFDKALADYRKVLQADPHDTQVRLRIGDLYAKKGDKAKSIEAYTQVASHLGEKGFEAKAVAIYKQILRIDPDQAEIRVQLGELYQRLGLTSDALREFQAATKRYQERGARRKAFELLRRVASLDPGNIPNRLRLVELLFREELKDEAGEEYQLLIRDVQSSGRAIDVIRVAEHMFERFPDDVDALCAYAKAKIESRSPLDAVEPIRKAFPKQAENIPLREALVEVYEAAGDLRAAQEVYREIAELYKVRGDEEKARDILQRYVPSSPLGGSDGDDAEPDSDPGIVLTEEVADSDPRGTSVPTIEPEGDLEIEPSAISRVDDLLAEAKVALQFGDFQEAETRARETLEHEPLSDGARAVLAEVAARQDNLPAAIQLTQERQELAAIKADADLLSEIEAQLRTYQGNVSATVRSQPEVFEELPDVEIMLEDEEDQDPTAASVEPPPELKQTIPGTLNIEDDDAMDLEPLTSGTFSSLQEEPPPPPELAALDGIEIDTEDDELEIQSGSTSREFEADTSATHQQLGAIEIGGEDDLQLEIESGSSETGMDSLGAVSEAVSEDEIEISVAQEPEEADEPHGIADELEEAEFYVEQGMLAEAERLLKSILERAPDHPHAMLRLGEIAAARGQAPRAAPAATTVPPLRELPDVGPPEPEPEPVPTRKPARARKPEPVQIEDDSDDHVIPEITLDLDDDDFEIPPEPPKPAPSARREPPRVQPKPKGPPSKPASAPSVELGSDELPVDLDDLLSEPTDDNPFDLAAELEQAVGEVVPEHDDPTSPDLTLGGVAPELEELFNSFKRGIQEQLGEDETEAHYDLGIAYREMGLLEDAIREFELASRGDERRLGSLALLGACKVDAGRPKEAVADLSKALKLAARDPEATKGLRYELASALEACGEKDRALKAYGLVKKADPDFRDVRQRIKELERS